MTRAELIRMFALNSMCDDYEDIEQITKWTVHWGSECGIAISHEDIIQALRELIEMGHAKAWDLTQPKPEPIKEYRGMPTPEEISEFDPYFFRTQSGLESSKPLMSDRLFDESNNLREVWIALESSVSRGEFVRLFVLDSVRDYRMTIGHIEKRTDALAKRCGITISRDEFMQALRVLVERGHAKAHDLDKTVSPPKIYEGMPPLEDIKPWGAYFYVTQEGLELHEASRPVWPFEEDADGEFELRKNWAPPEI